MANENDDILDPAEIEALLDSASGADNQSFLAPAKPAPATTAAPSINPSTKPAANQPLSHSDIDALLKEHSRRGTAGNPTALLDSAAASLAAAIGPDSDPFGDDVDPARGARPFEFQAFDRSQDSEAQSDMGNLKDVELNLRIELGRTELLIEEVLKLREGSVVALDKLAGDPVDILVNGRLVARGEVLVLNDNFCVRVAEILAPALV